MVGLLPQTRADPRCLLQEEKLILSGGVDPVVSQKQSENTAQASSWDSASSHPVMGATFCFPISRLMSAKEVNVPPPKITSHFRVKRAAYDPVEG